MDTVVGNKYISILNELESKARTKKFGIIADGSEETDIKL